MAEESGSSGILDILKLGLTFKAIDLVCGTGNENNNQNVVKDSNYVKKQQEKNYRIYNIKNIINEYNKKIDDLYSKIGDAVIKNNIYFGNAETDLLIKETHENIEKLNATLEKKDDAKEEFFEKNKEGKNES